MALSKIESQALDVGQIGGRRNIAYNGAMTVWQRGTTADTATSGDLMCDRWKIVHNGLDGNVDWDQETADTPDGFGYALKISTDASEGSLDAGDYLFFRQQFEGQDLQSLQKGSSGAKSLTLSFWVKSSVASTYTVALYDEDNNRNTSQSYAISSADTWEFKTVTFDGDTTGAFDNDNGDSLRLEFWIDAGSTFTSGTFSTSPQALNNAERVYDTTGWLESTTPTFYITGVQLEVGDTATPFEHRSYGEELALCQRYYERISKLATETILCNGMWYQSTRAITNLPFKAVKRTTPTMGYSAAADFELLSSSGGTFIAATTMGFVPTLNCSRLDFNTGSSSTAGQAAEVRISGSNGYVEADAEL